MSTFLTRATLALLMAFGIALPASAGWLSKMHEKYGSKITPNSANVVRQLTQPLEKESLRDAARNPLEGAAKVVVGGGLASLPREQTSPSKMARWERTADDMVGTFSSTSTTMPTMDRGGRKGIPTPVGREATATATVQQMTAPKSSIGVTSPYASTMPSRTITMTPPPKKYIPETNMNGGTMSCMACGCPGSPCNQVGGDRKTIPTFVGTPSRISAGNGRKTTMPVDCRKSGQLQQRLCM